MTPNHLETKLQSDKNNNCLASNYLLFRQNKQRAKLSALSLLGLYTYGAGDEPMMPRGEYLPVERPARKLI